MKQFKDYCYDDVVYEVKTLLVDVCLESEE